MDLDPTEYDVDELHEVAGSGLAGATPAPDGDGDGATGWATGGDADPADPTPEQCERLLRVGGVDPAAIGDRPYLADLPDTDATRAAAREWLAFLVTTGGPESARDAIDRYRRLGWLADDVAAELRRHVDAASGQVEAGEGSLDRADHLLSFGYLIRLVAARDTA
ncbi:MAG: FlaD/FlaE family flagellar protein [Haloferacaceae archaeon]